MNSKLKILMQESYLLEAVSKESHSGRRKIQLRMESFRGKSKAIPVTGCGVP
jgi:hypothetical protein